VTEAAFTALVARLEAAVDALEKQMPPADPADPLDVAAVKARYGIQDDRSARKVMHEAGALRVGGRLFVRLSDLERLEAARIERLPTRPRATNRSRSPGRRQKHEELRPGFWRQ
jgi:hypothetical protein